MDPRVNREMDNNLLKHSWSHTFFLETFPHVIGCFIPKHPQYIGGNIAFLI